MCAVRLHTVDWHYEVVVYKLAITEVFETEVYKSVDNLRLINYLTELKNKG